MARVIVLLSYSSKRLLRFLFAGYWQTIAKKAGFADHNLAFPGSTNGFIGRYALRILQ